ncbi:hypothetical protein CsSME_00047648 [Camellia sinensis var. sinensis]
MSSDATIATAGNPNAATNQSFRCHNCRIATAAAARCPGCHRLCPNPNYPSVSIYGPFTPPPTQTPLHTSDYIDSDDEDLFNSILDRISTQARQPKHLSHTSKSFINSLPILKITGSLLSKSCSICKDEFEKNDQVNPLPCDHVFHHNCILPWLNRSNSCPLCRYKLPMERRPKPLMLYVVRLGNLYVEGWGEDHESGFRDAVLRNGLFAVLTQQQSSSSSTATRMGRAERGSAVGTASNVDCVVASGLATAGDVNVMLDEDGDTVMLDA